MFLVAKLNLCGIVREEKKITIGIGRDRMLLKSLFSN